MTSGGVHALTNLCMGQARQLKPVKISTGCAGCRPAAAQWRSVGLPLVHRPLGEGWHVRRSGCMCELHHHTSTCVRPTRALESHRNRTGKTGWGAAESGVDLGACEANGDGPAHVPSCTTRIVERSLRASAASCPPPNNKAPWSSGVWWVGPARYRGSRDLLQIFARKRSQQVRTALAHTALVPTAEEREEQSADRHREE